MMAMYPLIGTIIYKDDVLELSIPLRAKLVRFNSLMCGKCGRDGNAKEWVKEWQATGKSTNVVIMRSIGDSEWKSLENTYVHESMLINGKLSCAVCMRELTSHTVEKIKVYATAKKHYLDTALILNQVTVLRRPKRSYNRFSGKDDCVSYYDYTEDSIKELMAACTWINDVKMPDKVTWKNTKFVPADEPLTLKSLQDAYEKYYKKKVIRKI